MPVHCPHNRRHVTICRCLLEKGPSTTDLDKHFWAEVTSYRFYVDSENKDANQRSECGSQSLNRMAGLYRGGGVIRQKAAQLCGEVVSKGMSRIISYS